MSSPPLSPRRPTRPAALVLVLVLALTVAVLAVVAAAPAAGQAPPPFACDGGLYVVTGTPTDMTLAHVDQNTSSLTPVGGGGLTANALAYNPADDYLYGMNRDAPNDVVRVAADGTQVSLGPAVGTPPGWEYTVVGTILENGRYLVLGETVPPSVTAGTVPPLWAEIDLTTSPPSVVRTFSHPSLGNNDLWDVAVSPIDGQLYSYSRLADRVVRVDLATGATTAVGPVLPEIDLAGSVFFDSFGRLWLYGAPTASPAQNTLFRIDDVFADTARPVGSGPAVTYSDGASCPFNVGMEKTAEPATVCAGESTTFSMRITNESPNSAPITADFLDRLDDGLTFVPDSLANPFGGEVGPYGGTGELAITDLTVPGGADDVITVDVAVPADRPPGQFTNQAALLDLSGNVGPAVLSEYPGTPQLPDATPVAVAACVDLALTKETDAPAIGPGVDVAYTVRVTNHGPSAATGVGSVTDAVPPGTTFATASDGGVDTGFGTVAWPAFDLAVGEGRDLGLTLRGGTDVADHADEQQRIVNTASVEHPGDTNPDNDTDTAAVPVARPDLAVTKDDGVEVVAAGSETTYELVATNHGDGPATGAVLTDTLPDNTGLVSVSSGGVVEDHVVTWSGLDLDPGESQTMTVTVKVDPDTMADETVTNVAVVAHDADPDPTDNRDDDTDTVTDPDPPRISRQRADPPAGPLGALPRTGSEALRWAWVATALLGLGGAAWVAANTRNP